MTWLTMSLGSKEKLHVRQLCGELRRAAAPCSASVSMPASGFELHLQHALLGPAVPQIDQVDRIVRRVHADERRA